MKYALVILILLPLNAIAEPLGMCAGFDRVAGVRGELQQCKLPQTTVLHSNAELLQNSSQLICRAAAPRLHCPVPDLAAGVAQPLQTDAVTVLADQN
jgi:hypothetical protein